MAELDIKKQQIERRNFLSSMFVIVLIGIAYAEMVPPVRESVRSNGITLGTSILFIVFFLTSMRFFMGNQLHLMSDSLVKMTGEVWFYDLMVIILQTVVLIFLGGVSSVQVNRVIPIGFIGLLIALYALDVLWIISQWLLGKLFKGWQRDFIPWAWAILNTALIICMIILQKLIPGEYTDKEMIWIGLLNAVGFIVDVMLVDYYDVI